MIRLKLKQKQLKNKFSNQIKQTTFKQPNWRTKRKRMGNGGYNFHQTFHHLMIRHAFGIWWSFWMANDLLFFLSSHQYVEHAKREKCTECQWNSYHLTQSGCNSNTYTDQNGVNNIYIENINKITIQITNNATHSIVLFIEAIL